ncbi:MAG: DUF5681 domain-containing protein [bacterium]
MSDDNQEEKPGFANPPSQHRFKRGQSGNPKGRPKGSRNLKTDLAALLKGNVEIIVNGKRRRITRQEAVLLSLFQKAISKESKAAKMLLDLVIKLQMPDDRPESEAALSQSDRNIVDNYLRRNGHIASGASDDASDP